MRYSIKLSFSGADFCGWQHQPSDPSVQQCLEEALSRLLGQDVAVIGAGRTDTGVNAIGYVACFDGPEGLAAEDFRYKLNAILPRSVAVLSVEPAAPEFHARFDAVRREYTYFLHRGKDPFMEKFSWQYGYPDVDFDAMNRAAAMLVGTHDFSCFEKVGGDNKTSVCTVFEAFWAPYVPSHVGIMGAVGRLLPTAAGKEPVCVPQGAHSTGIARPYDALAGSLPTEEPMYWYFRISADRFLRNMVRAVVGTLLEVGRGKRSPDNIPSLIESHDRSLAGQSVPGHALFLSKVLY